MTRATTEPNDEAAYARLSDAAEGSRPALAPLARLFAPADARDALLMALGALGAVVAGAAGPVQMVLLGDVINAFNPRALSSLSSSSSSSSSSAEAADALKDALADARDDVDTLALSFVVVGAAALAAGFLEVACWSAAGARRTRRLRSAYARALLSQELAWFDRRAVAADGAAVETVGSAAWAAIQDGAGSKVGDALRFAAMGTAGVAVGLATGWELALVLLALAPVVALSAVASARAFARAAQASAEADARAGSVAREALANVRTVQALGAVEGFASRYARQLAAAARAGERSALAAGWGQGAMFACIFGTYAAGLYVGALKVADAQLGEGGGCDGGAGCYDGGRVITVFMSVVMGAMALGNAGPCLRAVYAARAAAVDVLAVIDRPSRIDALADSQADAVATAASGRAVGAVSLEDVTFAYPSRPDAPPACRAYSLAVAAGETVALVGASGSGKSTVLALLLRLYDADAGRVALDGVDVRAWPVAALRAQFAVVPQEPMLFAGSILDNIRVGRPAASDAEVAAAAAMANAAEFIAQLPHGLATDVGEHGDQLSGGQKQRIAIARALLKDAPVLLLDEATSALDAESEHAVQRALELDIGAHSPSALRDGGGGGGGEKGEVEEEEKADEGPPVRQQQQRRQGHRRTTIVVAHRLATIRGADRIAFHRDGRVVELGSHDELMRVPDGGYRAMVEAEGRAETERAPDAAAAAGEGSPSPAATAAASTTATTATATVDESAVAVRADAKATTDEADEGDLEAWSVPTQRLWRLSSPERAFVALGALGAVGSAALYPVWAVLLTKLTVLFFRYDLTRADMLAQARNWSLGFVGIAGGFLALLTLQFWAFGVVAQRLIARVRASAFSAMLRQDMAWFDRQGRDDKDDSDGDGDGDGGDTGGRDRPKPGAAALGPSSPAGVLAARLASDCAVLQAATSDALNARLVNLTTLVLGLLVCFYYSWRLTLVMAATAPLFVLSSYMEFKQAREGSNTQAQRERDAANASDRAVDDRGGDRGDGEAAKAAALLAEAVGAIRAVAALGMERAVSARFDALLASARAAETRSAVRAGGFFGASLGLVFFVIAFIVWIGGRWFADGSEPFEDFMMVFTVVMLSAVAVGMAAQGPSAGTSAERVRIATFHLFRVIDRVPAIGGDPDAGEAPAAVRGELAFHAVAFRYPSRPDVPIYRDFSLRVGAGQTVALVGASGSGKSTAISLLERFYDPAAGCVTLDGTDLRRLRLSWLRERVSLVSQEPVLFAGSIADNIALGKPGASRAEVEEAARKANALDFIRNFPSGFDTQVGDRGAQVSGGQKQRIAIARAILRDPEVLLLDEATSALDNESERVVQASLDALLAAKRRTTVVVAHRLSTIRHADLIAVTQGGAIVEQGTHEQLLRVPNGVYKALVERQMGGAH